MTSFEKISERERRFLIQTYDRYPVAIERGKGVFLYDLEGKRYLDFVAGLGVNALGHAHPRIVKVTREQAARVIHLSNLYYNEYQGRLAEKLCSLSGLQRAFFSNSGTEAIEGSIKLARLAGHKIGGESKTELVALQGSYHGRTFGSMSLTGQDKYRKGFEPLLGEVTFIQRNDVVALRAAVSDNTCAIVLEPIFGEGGILECSVEFLQECRAAWRSPSRLLREFRWVHSWPGRSLHRQFPLASMAPRLAGARWLAASLWNIWRFLRKRTCWRTWHVSAHICSRS